eukprot:gene36059-42809_t
MQCYLVPSQAGIRGRAGSVAHRQGFAFIFQHMDQLLWGALLTIRLSALAMIFGLAVGICGAIVSIHGSATARFAVTSYVELIRSTPFLVQLFIIFFGLPAAGVQ